MGITACTRLTSIDGVLKSSSFTTSGYSDDWKRWVEKGAAISNKGHQRRITIWAVKQNPGAALLT